MKQFALAGHNHHDVHDMFPSGIQRPGTFWDNAAVSANSGYHRNEAGAITGAAIGARFNAKIAFFPFIEATALYEGFAGNVNAWPNDGTFEPGAVPILHCPSDRNTGAPGRGGNRVSMSNMSLSLGDAIVIFGNRRGIVSWPYPNPFLTSDSDADRQRKSSDVMRNGIGMAAITDGTSNTVFCSEVVVATGLSFRNVKGGFAAHGDFGAGGRNPLSMYTINTNRCMNESLTADRREIRTSPTNYTFTTGWRGGRPLDRWATYGWVFNTLLPPNAPACVRENNEQTNSGALTVQSFHTGGVNAGFTDGSVRFVTDSVDTNNVGGGMAGLPTPDDPNRGGHPLSVGASRFGVWGAMGSINGGESRSL